MSKILNEFLKRTLDNNENNFITEDNSKVYLFSSVKVDDSTIYYGKNLLKHDYKYPSPVEKIISNPTQLKMVAIRNKDSFLIPDRSFFGLSKEENLQSNLIDLEDFVHMQNDYANNIAFPRYLKSLPDIEPTEEQIERARLNARRRIFNTANFISKGEYICREDAICIFMGSDIDEILTMMFEELRDNYIKTKAYDKIYDSYIDNPLLICKEWELKMIDSINKAPYGSQSLKLYFFLNDKECVLTVRPETLKWALVTECALSTSGFVEGKDRVIKIFKELGLEKYDGLSLDSVKKITYAGKTLYEV